MSSGVIVKEGNPMKESEREGDEIKKTILRTNDDIQDERRYGNAFNVRQKRKTKDTRRSKAV